MARNTSITRGTEKNRGLMTQTGTVTPPMSQTIVETVADAEDVDPAELTPPLYDVVDTDALDEFIDATPVTDGANIRVTFTYHGYEITVLGDGHVTVEEQAE